MDAVKIGKTIMKYLTMGFRSISVSAFVVCLGVHAAQSNTARSPFDLEIPPPETVYPPVLKSLPNSIPQYQSIRPEPLFDNGDIEDSGLLPMVSKLRQKELIRVFAADGEMKSIGKTIEAENETGLFMNSNFIFVKIKKGEAKTSDKLLVVRDRGPLVKSNDLADFKPQGHSIQINCEIELVGRVDSEKPDPEYDYYRAKVIRAINLAGPGDQIIRGKIESTTLDANGPRSNVIAEIVGGENDARSGLFGMGSFVHLNKGLNEGIKVGDILPVFINRKFRNASTNILESAGSEGILKVVHADNGISTALIVKSNSGFRQGDRTGSLARNEGGEIEVKTEAIEEFDLSE